MVGYTSSAIKGISWMGALRVSTRGITIVRIAILARLLSPAQFGVVGIATLVLGFVEMLTETGINIFLVQEKEKIDRYINTAWVISIARGIVIALSIVIAAPFIGLFFNSQEAVPLVLLIGVVPFIRGFINPSVVQFQKELQFNREFWFRLCIFIVDATTAVILAFFTKSPASLIWGFVAGAITEVTLSFLFLKPKPRFFLETENIKKVIGRGKWITAAGIFEYLFQNLDDVVVGRLLGTAPLGLYQLGYNISTLPISEITDVVNKVMFPVYVRISDDSKRLRRAFFKTTLGVVLLTVPFGLVFFFFPRELILLFLGQQWLGLEPLLKVLAFFGVVRAISNSSSSLFVALKKQDLVAFLAFLSFLSLALIIVPAVSFFGVVGASLAALLTSCVVIVGILVYLYKVLL